MNNKRPKLGEGERKGIQKRTQDPLELELEIVVIHLMECGEQHSTTEPLLLTLG